MLVDHYISLIWSDAVPLGEIGANGSLQRGAGVLLLQGAGAWPPGVGSSDEDALRNAIGAGREKLPQPSGHLGRRHSRACTSVVTLEFGSERLGVTVADDGQGFCPAKALDECEREKSRLGLIGMRERVESLGGELQIRSAVGEGTRISFEVSY